MSESNVRKVTRRDALAGVAAATGAVAVGGTVAIGSTAANAVARNEASSQVSAAQRALAAPPSAEVANLFGPLASGGTIDRWRVDRVHNVAMGAIAVVMATASGERFQVDVLRRDPTGRNGVGTGDDVTVVVNNRGAGHRPTDEEVGLGAMALANVLEQRILAGSSVPALLTFDQRALRFPRGRFDVLGS